MDDETASMSLLAWASQHIDAQRKVIDQLMQKCGLMEAELRELRKEQRGPREAHAVARIKEICAMLRIDYRKITARTPDGFLSRTAEAVRGREDVVLEAREPVLGSRRQHVVPPMSFPEIAEGLGYTGSHTGLMEAERRAKERARGWALPIQRVNEYA